MLNAKALSVYQQMMHRQPRVIHTCVKNILTKNGVVSLGGLEPPTYSLEGCCSIQLSYRDVLSPSQDTRIEH